jgi:hypothetical protein
MRHSSLFLTSTLLTAIGLAATAEPTSVAEAVARGKASIHARIRYEGVDQTGLRDANALTLRTRLGYTTAALQGWKATVEAENITAADADSFSQAGINPGGAGRAVVADPEGTEINQAFLSYESGKTVGSLGRQRLVLDQARFIGDVGWRQNQQTFDALVVQDKTLAKTTLTYAYLHQINRVFGDRHPQGDWESASHVFNAAYSGLAGGTLTGYAYLLDFDNSAANSCATYGASYSGSAALSGDTKFLYRAEAAGQSDYASSRLNYSARYLGLEAGLAYRAVTFSVGYELLGEDNNIGFKTPLATLHAFNGWADLFLTTPAAGLRDSYLKVAANLPEGFSLLAFYHRFALDRTGADVGVEFDVQLSRKFGKSVTALAKVADFRRDSPAFPNVRKLWLQIEYAF